MIAPYESDRVQARNICNDVKYAEVFIDTSLEVCERRDVKGLYKQARAGIIKNFTGIDDPFEEPSFPDYVVHTDIGDSPEETAEKLHLSMLKKEK